jgi:CheY-like chemotaxis protein
MSDDITLFETLQYFRNLQYIGGVSIHSETDSITWTLYFYLGKLIWADGGSHPNRSWQRCVSKYLAHIDVNKIVIRGSDRFECFNYHILLILLQRSLINLEQLETIVKSKITESLFDILQLENRAALQYSYELGTADFIANSAANIPIASMTIEEASEQVANSWSEWTKNDFQAISPNHTPKLHNLEQIQQQMSDRAYQNFVRLIDGQSIIRDISLKINKSILQIAIAIAPFLRKELCELIDLPDLDSSQTPTGSYADRNKTQNSENAPLVACIDDSPQVGAIMKDIIAKAGYRFIYIQEPLQAVSKSIECNPDLIFLDLNMPIINGYEVCSQIRRVTKLKDVPVVMLTSNEGTIDRLRAKLVKASDFITKPIEIDEIIATMDKFLSPIQSKRILYERRKSNSTSVSAEC